MKAANAPQGVRTPVYSHEEEIERWKREYRDVQNYLAKAMASETPPRESERMNQPPQDERRAEPRYSFMPESKIFAHLGPRAFPVLNISVGGLAFHSDIFFEAGTKLLMSALGMIALDVEVLSCEMEETDADLMECKYRVRAKFSSHVNGYQVYVLAREMHLQNANEGGADPALTLTAEE